MNHDKLRAMKTAHRYLRVVSGLPLIIAIAAGCGGGGSTTISDMTVAPVKLTLTNVPTGCPTTETAADLYSTVVATSCALANCHSTNGTSFSLTSAADLHDKWVGKRSNLYPVISQPYVTAADLNQSWIMYKLTGSHGQYGSKMPIGPALTTEQLCKFVAWINSGAT
jgi:hypothetical protein